ncbi:hypothetical protein IFR05_007905 [Cadophora sp. M221]|nr:hypothetical protein IFR05_007905 [Cadophora sp. M221]
MSSTNENTQSTEPANAMAAPAAVNPFIGNFPPPDPNKPFKAFTRSEIELALIELTVEAAWENCQSKLKEAKTAAERRKIRRKEMHAVNTTSETAYTKEVQEVLDGRIRLLEWKQELGEWEEKYWFSRL